MAYRKFEVVTYGVVLWRRAGGGEVGSGRIVADGAGPGVNSMIIWFYPDDHARPANESILESNRTIAKMYLPASQYLWYIDLLRNEKPITAYVYDNPNMNRLAAGSEPTGEEET